MIRYPDVSSLLAPQTHLCASGRRIHTFPSASTELVKLDFMTDAGYLHQPRLLCASAAARLVTVATPGMSAQRLAEYLDARGVSIEANAYHFTSSLTVYTHRRYLPDLIPLLHDMLSAPAFTEDDFQVWRAAKRQEIAEHGRRTSSVARIAWNQAVFGSGHLLGRFATPEDADRLQADTVRAFIGRHYGPSSCSIVLSGAIDGATEALLDRYFPLSAAEPEPASEARMPDLEPLAPSRQRLPVEGAQQASLRIGCVLPSPEGMSAEESVRLALCSNLLGGYFGSRLMSNLREDKGYTYGIASHIRQYRPCRTFYIDADVADDCIEEAEAEVMKELRLLTEQPPSREELDTVRNTLCGDAMRMLDGVFERSDRFCEQFETGTVDLWKPYFASIVAETTPKQVMELAVKWLNPDRMTTVLATP